MIAYVDGSPVLNKVAVCIQGKYHVYNISTLNHFSLHLTNNEAEYLAVQYAMYFNPAITEIRSDSQLVVNQLNGVWKINKPELRTLNTRIRFMNYYHFGHKMLWTWVPRTQNLAGLHLDKLLKEHKKGLPCL